LLLFCKNILPRDFLAEVLNFKIILIFIIVPEEVKLCILDVIIIQNIGQKINGKRMLR